MTADTTAFSKAISRSQEAFKLLSESNASFGCSARQAGAACQAFSEAAPFRLVDFIDSMSRVADAFQQLKSINEDRADWWKHDGEYQGEFDLTPPDEWWARGDDPPPNFGMAL